MSANRTPSPGQIPTARRQRFEEFYCECYGQVFGYVLRRTQDPDDAADVIAETFLIAWRRLEEIPTGDQRRLWVYGVARRVLANHRRGQRRRSSLTDRLGAELALSPPPAQHTGELAELVAAFRRLSDSDREVLALEGWEELDYAQIGAVLGCSRNAVRIRLHRARRRLAQQVADQAPGAQPPTATVVHGETT